MKFILNTKFYPQPTWEFNLPAGHRFPKGASVAREHNRVVLEARNGKSNV